MGRKADLDTGGSGLAAWKSSSLLHSQELDTHLSGSELWVSQAASALSGG